MKAKIFFLCSFCLFGSLLFSIIWEVNQDGSGDFTTVRQGIEATANTDTVLVYPGTYYENLTIINKTITLGSLYLTTGDESYISQTILDGNHTSSVVRVENTPGHSNVIVTGFVIQNGIGYTSSTNFSHKTRGGGIYIDEADVNIEKCIVQNNRAWMGGGLLFFDNSSITLIGNTIRFNQAFESGGGICTVQFCSVEYDSVDLNNIYINYAGCANDILVSHWGTFQEIIVDTFTVSNPSEGYYYIYPASDGAGYPQPSLFSINIQNAKIQQVDSDLYVAANGDDSNSGTNESEPLQTVAFALNKIHSDSLNQKTIHIADGVYSHSLNNQIFPVHLKSNVDLIGDSIENTILDSDGEFGQIYGYDPQKNITIRNFSLINSRYDDNIYFGESTNIILDNLKFYNNNLFQAASIYINSSDMKIDNIIVENNNTAGCIYFNAAKYSAELNIANSSFINNSPETNGLIPLSLNNASFNDSLIVNMVNCQITNNYDGGYDFPPRSCGIFVYFNTKLNLINSIVADNTCLNTGAGILLDCNSTINIANSIVFGNTPYNICLDNFYMYDPNYLNAWNSLIEGGPFNQLILGNNYINWDDLTMLDEDPFFLNQEDYSLSVNSPCIDTGTLDLPYGVELPAYDLAGNPRVMGSNIDMGAYEYPGNAAPIYLEVNNENLSWQIPADFAPDSYNVYLDDEFQANVSAFQMEYILHNLIIGQTYKAGVSAVYAGEETAIIPQYFTYNPVGIEETTHLLPLTSHLSNYPNPFNPSTTINFNVTQSSVFATLEIFNIKGQKVKTLVNAQLASGNYKITWNGKDANNKRVSSGQYIVKLKQNEKETAKKIMMLK